MTYNHTSVSQIWAILNRHARDEISQLRLQELCFDNDRVSSLIYVHTVMDDALKRTSSTPIALHTVGGKNSAKNRLFIADLSRQRLTLETMNHLLRLASARDVTRFIRTLSWGQNDYNNPIEVDSHNSRKSSTKNVTIKQGEAAEVNQPLPLKTSPSMHMALRAPAHAGLCMYTAEGKNALDDIHTEWARIERLSTSIRKGQYRGATGQILKNVVVIGRGVAILAVKFIYDALKRDDEGGWALADGISTEGVTRGMIGSGWNASSCRVMRFISCIDPAASASALADLNPATTIIITIVLKGDDEMETMAVQDIAKKWLVHDMVNNAKPDYILTKHMMTVTGNARLYRSSKPETTFLIPEHSRSEAFTSFTAAGLLPLSIVFGWNITQQILNGAHDMDTHFVETNAPHNIPVLLALCDVWNEAFMKSSGRILLPFMEHLSSYPAFVAAVESQVYGRYERQRGSSETNTSLATAVAIDGGLFGSYDRVCFQGGRTLPSELVITMDSQVFSSNAATKLFGPESSSDIIAGHDALVCSFFAHADVLAFGSNGVNPASNRENSGGVLHINGPAPGMAKSVSFDSNASNFPDSEGSNGNRPSTLLILNRCDPFACGQLVALAEHRSIIAARCWGVENPFSFSQSYGTSIRSTQTELMKEKLFVVFQKLAVGQSDEDDDDAMLTGPRVNLATSTLLSSYASRNSKPTY